ncbi:MAG TPA: hypothetical protein VFQ61_16485, partial [Polyangiaceae bacterium]|nr:hypothetical protein [Polyangiaceae bacterium]
ALPKFDLERFDRIEDYALALLYAHGAYVIAWAPPRSLEELGAEAGTLKEVLLGDAPVQAARKIFESRHLTDIRSGTGYRDLGISSRSCGCTGRAGPSWKEERRSRPQSWRRRSCWQTD